MRYEDVYNSCNVLCYDSQITRNRTICDVLDLPAIRLTLLIIYHIKCVLFIMAKVHPTYYNKYFVLWIEYVRHHCIYNHYQCIAMFDIWYRIIHCLAQFTSLLACLWFQRETYDKKNVDSPGFTYIRGYNPGQISLVLNIIRHIVWVAWLYDSQ